jgi:hypothetical protein
MKNVNTQSCEQINRGLKGLAQILNNTTCIRHKILLLVLSHCHNCRQLSIIYNLDKVSEYLAMMIDILGDGYFSRSTLIQMMMKSIPMQWISNMLVKMKILEW